MNEIQKAQDLLTAKEEQKVAEDVNNLFADDEHTILADGITQKDIDVAKDQVNKLTDGAKKEELLNEIQKAQDLLTAKEEQKVAEDVNNLFADDEHTILADGITQKDIDVAKDQVNKLIDEAKKEELLNEIQKAQDLLNEMNKLTLNTLTAHSSEISGSARANSQLRISINGVAKTVIKADSEGKYEWRVSKLAVNDVIKVEMRNPETNKYDQFVDQRITDSGVTEEKITLNGMQEGDTKISGTTTPNAQVRINFDGKPKNIVTSDAQGNYEFVVASGLTTGTEIKVELKSKGTYSISETKTVIARVLTLNPITSADDVVISGKTRNPNQKLRISLNGKAKTIISSKEGVYEYRMGKVAADSAIKVEAMNGSTVIESVEQIVKGISNEERPDVKLDAIEAGTRTTITGKAPAKASLRISINGKTKSVVAADAEGNFSYMLGKVQAGDKVKIEIREGKTFVFATEVAAH
ncbi:Large repetitive protein [Brachybacterium faecium]|nr:Large repetitive protein [Brachybacterium faecium]